MNKGLSNELIASIDGFIHTLTRITYRYLYVGSLRITFRVSRYTSRSGSDNVATMHDGIYETAFQQLVTVSLNWR